MCTITMRARPLGYFSELPYAFEPRLGGRSNFSRKEVARFARHMFRLYRTLPQPPISAISHDE